MFGLSFLSFLQGQVALLIGLAVFVVSLWALIEVIITPKRAFTSEGKLTKVAWLGMTVFATAVSFVYVGSYGLGLNLMLLIIPGLFFADVRPVVSPYRRNGRR